VGEACSTNGEKRTAYRLLVRKPEGKTLGRSRRRWIDNIKTDLVEIGLVEEWCLLGCYAVWLL
jgi:hypothetical protein